VYILESKRIPIMKNLLLLFAIAIILSCHQKKDGDLGPSKEITLENLTTTNAPQGLEQRDGSWAPTKGWELVTSKDGNKVMLMQTGSDTGSAAFECKCGSGTGNCKVRSDVVICEGDCTDCETVLTIYDRLVKVNRTQW
jgi:hypothetical protein